MGRLLINCLTYRVMPGPRRAWSGLAPDGAITHDHNQMKIDMLAAYQVALARYPEMTVGQLAFLEIVKACPGASQSELATQLGKSAAGLSRLIDVWGCGPIKTERHKSYGLVKAVRDMQDDRLVLIYPTVQGLWFLEQLQRAAMGLDG